ncbi:MAG: hypothetical protein U0599_27020 [Vicinamibacteria bacterium]
MRAEELGPEEAKLVAALRSIPPSPLRDRLAAFVTELADFVAQPSCAEMQADGAPCTSAQAACDECRKMTALLDGLRRRLQEG